MEEIVGKKIEMTQIFLEDGTVVPVTKVFVQGDLYQGDVVDVVGWAKGKGFAGVIKRWGFSGGPRTHGQKDKLRSPGSIGGGTDPGRVWKGKKMPGRKGGHRVTVKNLVVVRTEDGPVAFLKGAVPGNRNSELIIRVKARSESPAVKDGDSSSETKPQEEA